MSSESSAALRERIERPGFEPPRGPAYSLSREERDALESSIASLVEEPDRGIAFSRLSTFLAELNAWNVRGNLVAAGDRDRLVRRHVVESLASVPLLDRLGGAVLMDIGSGGGLPGIPIAIVRPGRALVLVESRRLKSLFLERVVRKLDLPRAAVWQARVESLGRLPDPASSTETTGPLAESAGRFQEPSAGLEGPSHRPTVDLATSRAVARLHRVTRWMAPLVRPGGHLVLFKGSRVDEELREWEADPGPWTVTEISRGVTETLTLVALRRLPD